MRIAHIVPQWYLAIADNYARRSFGMHLLLYHWAKQSDSYVKFMAKSKVYKILDNSQFELRKEIDYDDLIRYAKRMKVHEIVAPDIMYNMNKTKKLIEDFVSKVPKNIKIQGVVCGGDFFELIKHYWWLSGYDDIDVIAFSKHGCTCCGDYTHYESRQNLFKNIGYPTKPIHFLGVNDIRDFFTYGIRSIDGKFLAKVAANGKIDIETRINPVRLTALFDLFRGVNKI